MKRASLTIAMVFGLVAHPVAAQYRPDDSGVLTPPPAPPPPGVIAAGNFRAVYAKVGRPRMMVFWNRALSEEVSSNYRDNLHAESRSDDHAMSSDETSVSRLGSSRLQESQGSSRSSLDVSSGSQRVEQGRFNPLAENVDFSVESAFSDTLAQNGAELIDRNLAMRTGRGSRGAGSRPNMQQIETDAATARADLLVEVLQTPAPGTPTGAVFKVTVKDIKRARLLASFTTAGNRPYRKPPLVPGAGGFSLRTEGGLRVPVAGAVLAMGNLAGTGEPHSRHRADLWAPETIGRLQPEMPVLIVGTALTMLDAVISLRRRGFAGPIVALSRRGLLPSTHAPASSLPVPNLTATDLSSLSTLTRRIRAAAHAAGDDWRSVIDSLRPITDFIWRSLPSSERERFLRHLRPFWDVHRHRSAPPAAAAIDDDIAAGGLTVRAGRILSIEDEPGHAVVTLRPRGAAEPERLVVQTILDATGIGRVSETTDPLLRRLIARGQVRSGPFGLGLDVDADFRARGQPLGGPLWTIGPLMRGALWECIAVPDIRNQAANLAAGIAAELARAEAA